MEVVQELDMLLKWYGRQLEIDMDGFDATIPLSVFVPNTPLKDVSTLLKIVWRKGNIEVFLDPEDGIADSENMLRAIREKSKDKKAIGSVLKIVFAEIGGKTLTPDYSQPPSTTSTPDYFLRVAKTSTPDSYHSSSSGSGVPIYYCRLDEEYQVLGGLGEGSNGMVYKCIHKLSGMEQAVKMVSERKWGDEVKAMCRAQHENVVRFYDAWIHHTVYRPDPQSLATDVEKMMCISMELYPSTLKKELEKRREEHREFSNEELENIFIEIAKGLSYIHEQGIAHRDLSMNNIFIDKKGMIKIGDFGSAIILAPGETTFSLIKCEVTAFYRAPEYEEVDKKVDIFSVGVIMYELMNPFMKVAKIIEAMNGAREGYIRTGLRSSRLGRAVASLLEIDPAKRPSAEAASGYIPSLPVD